jgi:hypothetical protein
MIVSMRPPFDRALLSFVPSVLDSIEDVVHRAVEACEHRVAMALRVELETISFEAHLLR